MVNSLHSHKSINHLNEQGVPPTYASKSRTYTSIGIGLLAALAIGSGLAAHRFHASSAIRTFQKTNLSTQKITRIKTMHAETLVMLEKHAQNNDWHRIKDACYDWWIFPTTKASRKYGSDFALSHSEIRALMEDTDFMRNYTRGVELVSKSWGYDFITGKPVENPQVSQFWRGQVVRLQKMEDSLSLFKETEITKNLIDFKKRIPREEPFFKSRYTEPGSKFVNL